MNINNLIIKSFVFLQNEGFRSEFDKCDNIVFTNSFIHENGCKIDVSVDVREHHVDLKIKKSKKILLTIEYGEVMENYDFMGLENMLLAIEQVYDKMKRSFYGFSKSYISLICDLYAEFIMTNFDSIMNA